LRTARIDACSLANNHILDFEEQGLLDTIAQLDDAGIHHAGAGCSPEDVARPALLDAPGGPVALLAFTDNEPPFAAGPGKPGTNYLPVSMEPAVLGRVEEALEVAHEAGAKTVVFSNHWGPNMVEWPTGLFRRFAHAVIDRGATCTTGIARTSFKGWRSTAASPSSTTPEILSTTTPLTRGCATTGPSSFASASSAMP
jgi:poly-gamma-glutamate synthesis protein (capsule biosynthesis protein)